MREYLSNFFFITIIIYINIHGGHQCSKNSHRETVDTEIIETTPHLKYLRDYNKMISHEQTFNREWFEYLKCRGTYDRDVGDVLRGLCSFCKTFGSNNFDSEWNCMDKCYTTLHFEKCLRDYSEMADQPMAPVRQFVKKLSGTDPGFHDF